MSYRHTIDSMETEKRTDTDFELLVWWLENKNMATLRSPAES